MSLRLAEGCDLDRFSALGGRIDERGLAMLLDEGLARRDQSRLIATHTGWLVLNSLIAAVSA